MAKYRIPTAFASRRPVRTRWGPRCDSRRHDPADGGADVPESNENCFLEVTYANGDKEVLYWLDFNPARCWRTSSGAKKNAIKDFLDHGQKGIRLQHLLSACVDEFRENEDLPNTTNPDDWARISGQEG